MDSREVERSAEKERSGGGELTRRLLVAAVGVPLAALMVWAGGWYLGSVMALVAGLGAREFFGLAAHNGGKPLVVPGMVAAVFLPLAATVIPTFTGLAPWVFGAAVVLTAVSLCAVVWLRGVDGGPLGAATATVVGAFYTGGSLAFALLLRHLPEVSGAAGGGPLPDAVHGGFLVAFPITVTWIGDSAAYFGGKKWGRKKLVPRISPGKTVVGGVAGLTASVVTSVLYALVFLDADRPFGMGVPLAVVAGLVIGVAAQAGDLTESVLKREAGVKDSGMILPGHGGVLDRFDALFFTIPIAYVFFAFGAVR